MWSAITGIVQIIFLLLKNKFEKDADEKKRKEDLHDESKTAIVSRDVSRINIVLDKLRK